MASVPRASRDLTGRSSRPLIGEAAGCPSADDYNTMSVRPLNHFCLQSDARELRQTSTQWCLQALCHPPLAAGNLADRQLFSVPSPHTHTRIHMHIPRLTPEPITTDRRAGLDRSRGDDSEVFISITLFDVRVRKVRSKVKIKHDISESRRQQCPEILYRDHTQGRSVLLKVGIM